MHGIEDDYVKYSNGLDYNTYVSDQNGLTDEQKTTALEEYSKMDTNNDGKVTATERIQYDFNNNAIDSLTKDDLVKAYGQEKADEMMKFDKNGDGKLSKEEFENANKKGPSATSILSAAAICLTVVGAIIGIIVWLSRRKDREKDKKEEQQINQRLTAGNVQLQTNVGNSVNNVRKPISQEAQQRMNDQFSDYSQSTIDQSCPKNSLNTINQSKEIGF